VGAPERMIDLVASALPVDEALPPLHLQEIKHAAFPAILDEEKARLQADPELVPGDQGGSGGRLKADSARRLPPLRRLA
jgi:hypothetical protein